MPLVRLIRQCVSQEGSMPPHSLSPFSHPVQFLLSTFLILGFAPLPPISVFCFLNFCFSPVRSPPAPLLWVTPIDGRPGRMTTSKDASSQGREADRSSRDSGSFLESLKHKDAQELKAAAST